MLCTFCLESQVPRIAPGGKKSKGYPGLTHAMDIPVVPRVGEEIFLIEGGVTYRHTITSVRYLIQDKQKLLGAQVLVSDGKIVE
jgi:hypothetical protein